ncbi:MAG TPA: glycosyltransferase family 9 protein [Gemmataceae bacterium]|nr:glycosyltransferase family 9 protein [Gemmataceae bacterium]
MPSDNSLLSALSSKEFERILLIKPSAVGDVIHTLPVLVKLRARYPAARIDWLLTPSIADLVGHHPALSNVVLFARNEFTRVWRSRSASASLFRLFKTIRQTRYDLVIDLHGQFRSALFTLASGAGTRIGFDRPKIDPRKGRDLHLAKEAYRHGWRGTREGAWVTYSHRIPIPTLDVHAANRYLWLGPLLGLDTAPPDFSLPVPSEAMARIDGLLQDHGLLGSSYAVLAPGTMWETKHWRPEGFAQVGRHLSRNRQRVVLAGSAKERERCQAVAAACPGACDLSGQTTLSELAALLQRAAICVTNDSGSMHLAVALGRPVVSIFGPTDPLCVGPYGRPEAVVRTHIPCSPCYLRKLRSCPYEHACMNEVSAEMVIERIEAVLAVSSPRVAG